MARRSFGSTRKLPSGRWQARWTNDEGEQQKAPETFKTKRDAEEFLALVQTGKIDLDAGRRVDAGSRTVGHAIAAMLEEEEVRLRRSTSADYAGLLKHCIGFIPGGPTSDKERVAVKEGIAHVSIFALRRDDVRAWLVRLQKRGLSPSRVRKAFILVQKCMTELVEDEVLERNPCAGLRKRLPELPKPKHTIIESAADIAALRDAFPERYQAMVEVLAWGGLRIGEAFALARGDIDLKHGVIHVCKSQDDTGGDLKIVPTKTGEDRYVAPGETTMRYLGEHLRLYVEDGDDSRLFTTARGVPLRYSNFRARIWLPAVKKAGWPGLKPHDLRASCASNLFALGLTVKEVQDHLGHKDPQVTLRIYTEVVKRRQVVNVRAIDAYREIIEPKGEDAA